MASIQCSKPAEQTCNQGQQSQSLGQKMSEMVTSVFKKEQTHQGHTTAQCHCQTTEYKTQTHSSGQTLSHGMTKTQTVCAVQTNGQEAHGPGLGLATTNSAKSRRNSRSGEHRRRGLLQKIKDGISGHSDSGSSSSESDSDDEKCGRKKASVVLIIS